MCEFCDSIGKYDSTKRGEPEEGIFYNEKENKHYLVVEEFRYERTRAEVKYCHWCGRKLEGAKK